MKRYILILALCVLSLGTRAQDDKKVTYLPEQGDVAIGFDAAPVLKYVGNLFNNTSDNVLGSFSGQAVSAEGLEYFEIDGITPDVSIMAKYMITDNLAVRANIGVQHRSLTTNRYVADDFANIENPLNEVKLIDTRFDAKKGFSAIIGAEYRKGINRIQGVFGGGFLIGSNSSKTEYRYANALTPVNQFPTTSLENTEFGNYRKLNEVTNSNFFFGFAGNVGVEYFVAPKVSLGAEVNISIYSVNEGQKYVETEGYNTAKQSVEIRSELVSPGDKAFVFGTNNLGGSLYLSFYF